MTGELGNLIRANTQRCTKGDTKQARLILPWREMVSAPGGLTSTDPIKQADQSHATAGPGNNHAWALRPA